MGALLKPVLIRPAEPEIEFNCWPRIAPGQYKAYCRKASAVYRDKYFKRWQCLLQFDVLNDSLEKIATVACFLNLGKGEKPRAGTMSNFYNAWVKANSGKRPLRHDRMTPRIFERRHATVEIADTEKNVHQQAVLDDGAYSVVRKILSWDTGDCTESGTERENDR